MVHLARTTYVQIVPVGTARVNRKVAPLVLLFLGESLSEMLVILRCGMAVFPTGSET
jgi:hypothetical protein